MDYWSVPALSHELKERLSKAKPTTFGAAQRIEGATPGGLLALYSHIRAREKRKSTVAVPHVWSLPAVPSAQ
jgi:tRNA uridine 5-carboxymethylaminomethyl modification enzyme